MLFDQISSILYSIGIQFHVCVCAMLRLCANFVACYKTKCQCGHAVRAHVAYLAMACFDVDGGSSSSHGHTDTETVAVSTISSSHGHTAWAELVANDGSKLSAINFVASLCVDKHKWKTSKERPERNECNQMLIEMCDTVRISMVIKTERIKGKCTFCIDI